MRKIKILACFVRSRKRLDLLAPGNFPDNALALINVIVAKTYYEAWALLHYTKYSFFQLFEQQ